MPNRLTIGPGAISRCHRPEYFRTTSNPCVGLTHTWQATVRPARTLSAAHRGRQDTSQDIPEFPTAHRRRLEDCEIREPRAKRIRTNGPPQTATPDWRTGPGDRKSGGEGKGVGLR